jgi:hypothetical protein
MSGIEHTAIYPTDACVRTSKTVDVLRISNRGRAAGK